MKLLYKPIAIVAGVVAGRAANSTFQSLWSLIDDRDPPKPTTAGVTLDKVMIAAVLEAATQAAAGVIAARASAQVFNYLFGVWPGERARSGE